MKEIGKDWVYGVNPILEVLKAGSRPVEKIFIARERRGRAIEEIIERARALGIPIRFEPKEAINKRSGTEKNQGVLGLIGVKGYIPIDDLLKIPGKRGETPFFLILDSIQDPRNFGAIIRTAEAGGVHGIIVSKWWAAGLTETVAKTSAGAIEYVPICRVGTIPKTIDLLKKEGLWIAGMEVGGERLYYDMDFNIPLALIAGAEGWGLSELVRKKSDFLVSLPLHGKVNSLNVSVAVGIVIYEIGRQRAEKREN